MDETKQETHRNQIGNVYLTHAVLEELHVTDSQPLPDNLSSNLRAIIRQMT